MSRQFATNVTTIYDIFCQPSPSSRPLLDFAGNSSTKMASQRAQRLKKFNLEGQYWKNQAFNTEWKFQSRMKFSFRIESLSDRRKTGPGIELFNREWNFHTENENFKREWKFRASGNGFFMRSSENEFFRSPGPLGYWKLRFQPAAFLRSVFWATKCHWCLCFNCPLATKLAS